jgi:glutamyl-Q tRNA(Asp) synthetase
VKKSSGSQVVGRFAPSPTGMLHTGSLVAAIGSYIMAKQADGKWLLRLDDLDTQRQIPGMADDIMKTLESFGLFWDGEVSRQSRNIEHYQHAFADLYNNGFLYPCSCSRKDIAKSSSAPHPDDDCIPYSGTCRTGINQGSAIRSWRVRVKDAEITFSDMRKGWISQNLAVVTGDFVVKRSDGAFAYQLAVVVDDFLTGVNQVVRGEDLLTSTPRQILLQNILGYPNPEYCHLPLVTETDGSKLSKRDNLISHQLGNAAGRKNEQLFYALRFLGQNPPEDLLACNCDTILQWGIDNFKSAELPT